MKPPRLVDVDTSGATVTSRSATPSTRARSSSTRPKPAWVERRRQVALRDRRGNRDDGRVPPIPAVEALPRRREQDALARVGPESVPFGLRREPGLQAEPVDLVGREERGVVLWPARDLEPVALDRVGEDDGRAIVGLSRLPEGAEDVGEIVAAEVAYQPPHAVLVRVEQPGEAPPPGRVGPVEHDFAHRLLARAEQGLVLLVGHLVDPAAELAPAFEGEGVAQAAAVLELDHVPAVRPELRLELCGADARDDAVERLTVEVDDPEDVAEPARQRVGERLPDVSLVELGVPEQGDEAPAGRRAEPRLRKPVGERPEERCRRAEPDRSGRVVDREGILGARGVRLEAAEVAQPGQVGAVEPSEEVFDRMQHRRGMGLDGHAVLRAEIGEVERRHQGHHRRRRRLMAAHLEGVALRPLPVRVVHDPHREPEDAALDRLQGRDQLRLCAGGRGGGRRRHASRQPNQVPMSAFVRRIMLRPASRTT